MFSCVFLEICLGKKISWLFKAILVVLISAGYSAEDAGGGKGFALLFIQSVGMF